MPKSEQSGRTGAPRLGAYRRAWLWWIAKRCEWHHRNEGYTARQVTTAGTLTVTHSWCGWCGLHHPKDRR
jgi:hypothetical protein